MSATADTKPEIDFIWNSVNDLDDEKCQLADRLDRARIAKFLTNYLSAEGKERNYVLNVNAQWGAGKTYFIKRWKETIQDHYPVVYIDAWQQDYSDDPLLTVISSIFEQLEELHPNPGDPRIRKATKGLLGMFKVAAPFVAKAVVKKVSGVELDELGNKLQESSDETEDAFTGDASELSGKIVEGLLKDHSTKRDAIKNFKVEIKTWLDEITQAGNKHDKPLFVFIDELDRCRPSYAVEMLEVIKHLFDIKGVVFVVATDTEQLQHAVRVVYGSGFDASTYLGRFFNRRITLSCDSIRDYIQNLVQYQRLKEKVVEKEGFWPHLLSEDELLEQIATPVENYHLDLRTVERIIDRLLAIIDSETKPHIQINLLFLSTLFCIHDVDHPLFELLKSRKIATSYGDYVNQVQKLKLNLRSIMDTKILITLEHDRYESLRIFSSQRMDHILLGVLFIDTMVLSQDAPEHLDKLSKAITNQHPSIQTQAFKTALKASLCWYKGGYVATLSNYINWTELASTFDE